MIPSSNKPKMREGVEPDELIKMQTAVGLLESMGQSKTLTALVIVAITLIGGFLVFLASASA